MRGVFGALSELVERASIMAKMGKGFGTKRDFFEALGYVVNPTFEDYWWRYKRTSLGKRIVQAYPKACWQRTPQVQENQDSEQTTFEKAWTDFSKQFQVFQVLRRLDILCGIGQYGVLYMGYSGMDLSAPLMSSEQFLYMRPFTSSTAQISDLVTDKTDPRYGQPLFYSIQLSGKNTKDIANTQTTKVHFSRVIHVAEDIEEGEIYGTPRLEAPLNDLQSLDYVVGGSGEMFWRGAFPGYALLARDGFSFPKDGAEKSATEDEMSNFIHGLKRHMKLKGVDVHDFEQQASSPKDHYEVLLSSISSATGIPRRILTGSERGELASSQDRDNWGDQVSDRQRNFCEPCILRPFIDFLANQKTLPTPSEEYIVGWPPIQAPSSNETAVTAKAVAEALNTFASGAAEAIMPLSIYYKRFLNFTVEETEELEDALMNAAEDLAKRRELIGSDQTDLTDEEDPDVQDE